MQLDASVQDAAVWSKVQEFHETMVADQGVVVGQAAGLVESARREEKCLVDWSDTSARH